MTAMAHPDTLGALFSRLAHTMPEAIALRDAVGATQSYGEFHRRTLSLCSVIGARGLEKSARVAVLSKNRKEFAETFGLAQLGLVVVPLNWRLPIRQIIEQIADCRPAVLFIDAHHLGLIAEQINGLPPSLDLICYDGPDLRAAGYEELLAQEAPAPDWPDVQPEDPVCIIYTSGTTGTTKGAVISHHGALANMCLSRDHLSEVTPEDRVLAAMPFFHVGGLWYHFFAAFACGCQTTILPEFSPKTVLQVLDRDRITVTHLVPTMIAALLDVDGFDDADLGSLRRVFYAASPMPSSLLKAAMHRMPQVEFAQSYGSTEAGIISVLTPEDHRRAAEAPQAHVLRSCGRPVVGVDLRITANVTEQEPGAVGEVEIRSKAAIARYWNQPAATEDLRQGPWVRTGDLGYMDTEGYLYLVDRKADMIITGGENVFPTEVEEHLLHIDGIAEAAVFGVPHPRWIEQVTAVVVPRTGAELVPAEILKTLRTDLAAYKCPKRVFVADQLPRNGVGKILRVRLKETYASTEEPL